MRCEHIERIRRRVAAEVTRGGTPPDHWDAAHPWTCCFMLAAKDDKYWTEHVKERAIAWLAQGGRAAPKPADAEYAAQHLPGMRANLTPDHDRSNRKRDASDSPERVSPKKKRRGSRRNSSRKPV